MENKLKYKELFKTKIIIDQHLKVIDFFCEASTSDVGLKIQLINYMHFFSFFFSKKKKIFYQNNFDYSLSDSEFLKWVFKKKTPPTPSGQIIFETLKNAVKNNLMVLIIGNDINHEKKIRDQFDLLYGSSKSLFFFNESSLNYTNEKIKQFLLKTKPKIVLINNKAIPYIRNIIPNLNSSLIFNNLDIEKLYVYKKKKKNYTIRFLKYFFFAPFIIFYFFLLKMEYNKDKR